MASDTAVMFVGLVGVGILVVGVMILMKQQQVDSDVKQQKQAPTEVVVQDAWPPLWNAWGGWGWPWIGPYYSRIPLRPVVY